MSIPSVMDFEELGFIIRILREIEATILAFWREKLSLRGVVGRLDLPRYLQMNCLCLEILANDSRDQFR